MFGKFHKLKQKGMMERWIENEKLATRDRRTPMQIYQDIITRAKPLQK